MAADGEREKKGSVYLIPPRASEKVRKPHKREQCKTIYVGGLPGEIDEQNMHDAFGDFGSIQAIRMNSTKRYCHIQFMREQSAEKAMLYNNYWLRIGPENSMAHVSRLNVNYAHYKDADGEGLPFCQRNLTTVSQQLKDKMLFDRACLQVKQWLEAGYNTAETASSFFALVSAIRDRAEHVLGGSTKYNQEVRTMLEDAKQSTLEHCQFIEEILEVAATNPKSWDNFSKPQQNSVSTWLDWLKSSTRKLKEQSMGPSNSEEVEEHPPKKMKIADGDDHYREEIRKLKGDLEASKTKHLQELASKQNQVTQLTTISQQFRKRHLEEWKQVSEKDFQAQQDTVTAAGTQEQRTSEEEMETAAVRNHSGLSQHEIAIVSVLATFLAVHPLGASLGEIAEYAGVFNSHFKSDYIESLMRKLPEVFRVNKPAGEDEAKWWFLGFQSMSLPFKPTVQ